MKKTATIDLTDCKRYTELFERIYTGLNMSDYNCGKNWDAFWDCISGLAPINDITVIGRKTVANELQPYVAKMLSLLQERKEQIKDDPYWTFDYRVID